MHSTAFPRCFVLILAALLLICLFSASAFGETSALILPASLKRVEAQAFFNDSSIRSIVIPDSASSIGDEAFSGCTSLTEITIPESVISIGDNAFSGCDDLTIRCQSDSYAAAYAQAHGINLSYIDVSENRLICVNRIQSFDPDSLRSVNRPTFAILKLPASIQPTDDDSVLLAANRTDDNSANTVSVAAIYDEATKQITAFLYGTEEASLFGDISVRIDCNIYDAQNVCTFSDSMDFTISFSAALSNPPTGIQVPQANYQLQPGETLCLKNDDIQPADGDLGDFDCIRTYKLESCIAGNGNLVYQNDILLNITFQNSGSYVVYAQLRCAGYEWETPIHIAVGDDPYAAANLSFDLLYDSFYIERNSDSIDDNIWIARGSWNGLGDTADKWVKLTIVPEAAGQPDLDIAYFKPYTLDVDPLFEVSLSNLSNCAAGSHAYSITLDLIDASGNTLFTQSIPFTLKLVEIPENLLTGIYMKQSVYNVQPGDTLRIHYSDIELIGGVLPEDAAIQNKIGWTGELACAIDNSGYTLFFPRAGSCTIDLLLYVNNLYYHTAITVNVGSAPIREFQPTLSQFTDTVYVDGTESSDAYNSIAHMYFWELPDGIDRFDWTLTPITAGENALKLYISEFYGDHSSVSISANHSSETAAGQVVYRCTCTFYDAAGNIIGMGSRDIAVDCIKTDAPLPTGFELPYEDTIFLNLGDSFTLDYNQIVFTGNALPDGVKPRYSHEFRDSYSHYLRFQDHRRTEYVFNEPCRTTLSVWVRIGDMLFSKELNIIVANGLPRSARISINQWTNIAYIGTVDINNILCAWLENFNLLPDEQLYWDVTRLSDDTNPGQIAIYYNNISDDAYEMAEVYLIHLDKATEGTLEYMLNCHVLDENHQERALYSKPIRVELQAIPDNLPTELLLPQDEYHFEAGTTHKFLYSDISFADGEVPENAEINFDYYIDPDYCPTDWREDGITVHFNNSGRYYVSANATINNLIISKKIRVIVESQDVVSPILTFDSFEFIRPLDNDQVGWVHFLSTYVRTWDFVQEGETVEWTMTELGAKGNPPALQLEHVSDRWANVSTVNATSANTGDRSFRLTFTAKDAQGNIIAQASKDFQAFFTINGTQYEISCEEIG